MATTAESIMAGGDPVQVALGELTNKVDELLFAVDALVAFGRDLETAARALAPVAAAFAPHVSIPGLKL